MAQENWGRALHPRVRLVPCFSLQSKCGELVLTVLELGWLQVTAVMSVLRSPAQQWQLTCSHLPSASPKVSAPPGTLCSIIYTVSHTKVCKPKCVLVVFCHLLTLLVVLGSIPVLCRTVVISFPYKFRPLKPRPQYELFL